MEEIEHDDYCEKCYPCQCQSMKKYGYDCDGYCFIGRNLKKRPCGILKSYEEFVEACRRNKFGPCKCKDKINHNCGIIKIGLEMNFNYYIIPDWKFEVEERAKRNIYK